MNDLIKALAEQASHQSPDGYPVTIPYSDDFVNKFADLLIKHCGYCADIFVAVGCPVDMDPTETKPSDYIKKRLGVE